MAQLIILNLEKRDLGSEPELKCRVHSELLGKLPGLLSKAPMNFKWNNNPYTYHIKAFPEKWDTNRMNNKTGEMLIGK